MYSLVYVFGFFLAVFFRFKSFTYHEHSFSYALYISTYAAVGAISGGRLGYVLFYEPLYYLEHPEEIICLYCGGMSFFGGALGLILLVVLCDRKGFARNLEHFCILACLVLPLGRIANFFNGELWGTPTDLPWGVVFAGADSQIRHPVQLYEALLEGPVLLGAVICSRRFLTHLLGKMVPVGTVTMLFGFYYGLFRFAAEFVREPDRVVGYVFMNFSMGHILAFLLSTTSLLLLAARLARFSRKPTLSE
ncbi:MAG: prolipoprotein diacylglyceryl transferase [Succinivibrionaceae bacterium]|nr:prolipoprotein diacylglyceryl transferase [Succinivibrionaceae bacterium]